MTVSVTTVVIGILAAIGGGLLASIVNGIFTRSKTSAEAESTRATAVKVATETTLSIIKDLREEIGRLSKRLNETEQESEDARTRAEAAERRAGKAEYDVVMLRRGLYAYELRVKYLTKLLEDSGLPVSHWTPPDGIRNRSERNSNGQ